MAHRKFYWKIIPHKRKYIAPHFIEGISDSQLGIEAFPAKKDAKGWIADRCSEHGIAADDAIEIDTSNR